MMYSFCSNFSLKRNEIPLRIEMPCEVAIDTEEACIKLVKIDDTKVVDCARQVSDHW